MRQTATSTLTSAEDEEEELLLFCPLRSLSLSLLRANVRGCWCGGVHIGFESLWVVTLLVGSMYLRMGFAWGMCIA